MIYVKIIGRLGNQLFYYSVARMLQDENKQLGDICLIPEKKNYEQYGGIQLNNFKTKLGKNVQYRDIPWNIKICDIFFKIIRAILTRINQQNYKRVTYKLQPLLNYMGLYNMVGSENIPIRKKTTRKNIYISGVWENPYYFKDKMRILQDELVPNTPVLEHNREFLKMIENTNSVCISIRKGDFLKPENHKFNLCDNEYFYAAIEKMKMLIGDFQLFVFSDDILWVKRHMKFEGMKVYYEQNEGNDPVSEKLRLMSKCKHFIISNSTFSWWAQALSKNENKIVIAPSPWRRNEYCDCLYDEHFILLNVS